MEAPLIKWGLDITKVPKPVQASKEPIIRFFGYHDSHPVALVMVLFRQFGADWVEWEPETLKAEVLSEFNATSISENNWQKIQAARTLFQSSGFWSEWEVFEKIIQALNNNIPRFDISQPCSLPQLMAGIDIANTLREESFDDEIQRYVVACALEEGVIYLPETLTFAQEVMSAPYYECEVCGQVETDDIDGRCDYCTGRFSDDRPLNFKPARSVDETTGTKLRRFLLRDPKGLEARYRELLAKPKDDPGTLDERNPVDVQAAKLVVAYRYMEKRRAELVEQLEEIERWTATMDQRDQQIEASQ